MSVEALVAGVLAGTFRIPQMLVELRGYDLAAVELLRVLVLPCGQHPVYLNPDETPYQSSPAVRAASQRVAEKEAEVALLLEKVQQQRGRVQFVQNLVCPLPYVLALLSLIARILSLAGANARLGCYPAC